MRTILLLASGAFAIAVGVAGLLAVFFQDWSLVLGCHLLSGAGSQVCSGCARRRGALAPFAWTVAFAVPVLGGSLLALHALGARLLRRQGVGRQFVSSLLENLPPRRTPSFGAVGSFAGDSPVSLRDILRAEVDDAEKRAVISYLEEMETPASVEILKGALGDPSPEVRMYAASAMARLEKRLNDNLSVQERRLNENGAEPARAHQRLAQACFDFIYFGLVEGPQAVSLLERGLEHGYRAIDQGGDPQSWLVTGRILLGLDRHDEAELMFNAFLGSTPGDQRALLWRAECRYQRRDFAGMRADMVDAVRDRPAPEPLRATCAFWLGERAVPAGGRRL